MAAVLETLKVFADAEPHPDEDASAAISTLAFDPARSTTRSAWTALPASSTAK
jgi:hypothetical protein